MIAPARKKPGGNKPAKAAAEAAPAESAAPAEESAE
jgi:hypothetical protein